MSKVYNIENRQTSPFVGQAPGTSGLRKPVKTFMQLNYTENFVQAILTVSKSDLRAGEAFVLVLGGDGRYYNIECLINVIIPMCAANGVDEVIVGENAILSTPAISATIRKLKTHGGMILTASHNPGGPNADFGLKYNMENGGPAPEAVTNACYEITKTIREYTTLNEPLPVDLKKIGSTEYSISSGKKFKVTIISSVAIYTELMSEIFDFDSLKTFFNGSDGKPPFKVLLSGLHGVTGPYIKHLLLDKFGLPTSTTSACNPLPDFGGHHPDPNLTYAASLVNAATKDPSISLAAAFDGDGDRNMIIGADGFFVTPCDSLAVIADYAESIKYFKQKGVKGFARSMPTSPAVDRVCKAKNLAVFETPTGWKFFGNLLDADMCSVCGEESFGTGSNHIREKDGIWAFLAWASLIDARQKAGKSTNVKQVMQEHWAKYGRDFFTRYDYENCTVDEGAKMMDRLVKLLHNPNFVGKTYKTLQGVDFKIMKMDIFEYVDPVDQSKSTNQGYRIFLDKDTRFVYRLSGTGSSGATLRVYVNSYSIDPQTHKMQTGRFLGPQIELALSLCGVEFITGRTEPTVIT